MLKLEGVDGNVNHQADRWNDSLVSLLAIPGKHTTPNRGVQSGMILAVCAGF